MRRLAGRGKDKKKIELNNATGKREISIFLSELY